MRKRYKVFLIIIVVLLVLLAGTTVYMKYFRKQNDEITNKSNIVHNIEKFGYTLDDRDTKLMKEEFYQLEEILAAEEINYEEYAKSLSKLFVIDLYTIDNKINKYDIGGLEYLLESEKEKFKNIILDSIYASVLDNSYHKREQELPEVKTVTVNSVSFESYQKEKETVEAYVVSLAWDYVKELGYDSAALITLIQEEDRLYVVEYQSILNDTEEEIE